jgi:hypothetical protein
MYHPLSLSPSKGPQQKIKGLRGLGLAANSFINITIFYLQSKK